MSRNRARPFVRRFARTCIQPLAGRLDRRVARTWPLAGGLARRVAWTWPLALGLALCLPVSASALAVGHTTITFVDPARNNRQIPTEIYYPADVAGEGVPPADPGPAGFPSIHFGHGYLMSYDRYAYLWQGLVPEGFIVALPRTEGNLFPSHGAFGLDLAFLVLALQAEGADPGSLLFGAVGEAAAVAGHSMGGGASLLAAQSNPAVTALFNLAAAETHPSAIEAAASVTAPALLLSGSVDCVASPAVHQLPMYDALGADCRTWVGLTGASHCQFAEQSTICELGEGGCADPTLTRSEQHALTLQLLLPWLRHTLQQAPGAWDEFQGLLAGLAGIASMQDCPVAEVSGDPSGPASPRAGSPLAALSLAPNPAPGPLEIRFHLSTAARIEADVVGVEGRGVRRLLDAFLPEGAHRLVWDGRDARARAMPAGLYWVRLRTPGQTLARPWLRID